MHTDPSPQVTAQGSDPAPASPVTTLEDRVLALEKRARANGMKPHRLAEIRRIGDGHAQLLMRESELQTWLDAN
jgi:hypothetical protein